MIDDPDFENFMTRVLRKNLLQPKKFSSVHRRAGRSDPEDFEIGWICNTDCCCVSSVVYMLFHSILFFYLAANVLPSAFWCMSASLSSLSQQKRFLCISYLFNYKLDLSLNVGISISIRLQLV